MSEGSAGTKADIGVTGLAVMGRNLARNLARHEDKLTIQHDIARYRLRPVVRLLFGPNAARRAPG